MRCAVRIVLATWSTACTYTPPPAGSTGAPTSSGTASAPLTEVFVQQPAVADVLFAIDDSCSMADDQASLTSAFPAFLDAFLGSGADWHFGVVTTDLDGPDAGALAWFGAETADPVGVFDAMADVGTTGSGVEQGLGAMYLALEDPANAAFLRPDSGLHLVVLSDERDATPASLVTPTEFADWLAALGQDRPAVSFNPIVQTDGRQSDIGQAFLDVNAAIGGLVYDIDDVDYTLAMSALGLVTSSLVDAYCLAALPDPATVAVTVITGGGAVLAFVQGVDYEVTSAGCVSFFAFVPSPGDEVHVSYVPAP